MGPGKLEGWVWRQQAKKDWKLLESVIGVGPGKLKGRLGVQHAKAEVNTRNRHLRPRMDLIWAPWDCNPSAAPLLAFSAARTRAGQAPRCQQTLERINARRSKRSKREAGCQMSRDLTDNTLMYHNSTRARCMLMITLGGCDKINCKHFTQAACPVQYSPCLD